MYIGGVGALDMCNVYITTATYIEASAAMIMTRNCIHDTGSMAANGTRRL